MIGDRFDLFLSVNNVDGSYSLNDSAKKFVLFSDLYCMIDSELRKSLAVASKSLHSLHKLH